MPDQASPPGVRVPASECSRRRPSDIAGTTTVSRRNQRGFRWIQKARTLRRYLERLEERARPPAAVRRGHVADAHGPALLSDVRNPSSSLGALTVLSAPSPSVAARRPRSSEGGGARAHVGRDALDRRDGDIAHTGASDAASPLRVRRSRLVRFRRRTCAPQAAPMRTSRHRLQVTRPRRTKHPSSATWTTPVSTLQRTGVMQRVPCAITPLTAVAEPVDDTGWAPIRPARQ